MNFGTSELLSWFFKFSPTLRYELFIKKETMFCIPLLAKSLQSCLTLCDPIDGSPPDSPVPGILQARTLQWVAISFSSAWKWKVKVKSLSRVWLLSTSWTAYHEKPPEVTCTSRGTPGCPASPISSLWYQGRFDQGRRSTLSDTE